MKSQNSSTKIQIKFNNRNSKIETIGFSHSLKIFFLILHFTFIIFHSSLASAIEVGGHLTEDTTWTPDNNPYDVIETICVNSGVTLTILPGTEIRISGASCTNSLEQSNNFWLHNGVSVAKMFWVDGRILAEGTEQDSILFTRLQDDPDYYWGTIYITEEAGMSNFEHCKIEYSAGIGISFGNIAKGCISIYNGLGKIKNCLFINNASNIVTNFSYTKEIEIISNTFTFDDNVLNYVLDLWMDDFSIIIPADGFKPGLVAGNIFDYCNISSPSFQFVNNTNNNSVVHFGNSDMKTYIYDNFISDNIQGIYGGHFGDSIYIKKNNFLNASVNLDEAYVEICDNYFEGCGIYSGINNIGKVYNNFSLNGRIRVPGYLEVFDNISIYGIGVGIEASWRNISCYNNLALGNEFAIGSGGTLTYNNNIIMSNCELNNYPLSGNPIFRNCIIDFPLDPPLVDGGGNIIVDSLQAQTIFEDIQNGDFHITPGSIAIDAGFDTLGYYYPFDMDYNQRVWDGNGNGTAIIDIGPYEYGAPAYGGIQGSTYDPVSGLPVDYVLIKINNEPGEFTFSDSVGNYEYKLPAGIYDVYAERVFYDDAVEFQVEVIDGEFTQLDIPMNETVDIQDEEIIPTKNDFNLTNFPNPFNPSTTISFSVTQTPSMVELSIYNIKGQKVKTFAFPNGSLGTSEQSVVWNGTDDYNKPVSSGIYFINLKTNTNVKAVKKCLLIK